MSKAKAVILAAVAFALGLIAGLVVNVSRDPLVDSLRRENRALRDLTSTQQELLDEIGDVLQKP